MGLPGKAVISAVHNNLRLRFLQKDHAIVTELTVSCEGAGTAAAPLACNSGASFHPTMNTTA